MPNTPLWKHFAAFIYDVFPIVGILLITSLIVLLLRQGTEVERYSPWFTTILVSEIALYYIYSWKIGGQTLGMRAWKIKIVPNQANQHQLTWKQAITRFFIGLLSTALAGFGLFWKVLSQSKKSWMDLASDSGTINLS